ncbi:hypothetical protein R3P38DRAFT_3241821 [Favolaschia claudopus]|uniref:Uncharacterized protein n=1 Tax=Favolaschia claudopus TaxID=2862362 RepID=A0AAV9Z5U9_9AGAR
MDRHSSLSLMSIPTVICPVGRCRGLDLDIVSIEFSLRWVKSSLCLAARSRSSSTMRFVGPPSLAHGYLFLEPAARRLSPPLTLSSTPLHEALGNMVSLPQRPYTAYETGHLTAAITPSPLGTFTFTSALPTRKYFFRLCSNCFLTPLSLPPLPQRHLTIFSALTILPNMRRQTYAPANGEFSRQIPLAELLMSFHSLTSHLL